MIEIFKTKLWLVLGLLFLVGCSRDHLSFLEWDTSEPQPVILTSATIEDLPQFKALLVEKASLCGLPNPHEDNLGNWFYEHHLRRVEDGSPYHLYVVKTQCGQRLGYVHLGVMPTLGYCKSTHAAILSKWVSLGVLEEVKDECNPCECTFKRVDNRGLAFILPILKDDLSRGEEEYAINASINMLKCFVAEGKLLPCENTIPYQVVGLFKPTNDIINSFEGVGFKVDENEGFYKFYHKDRAMVTRVVQ